MTHDTSDAIIPRYRQLAPLGAGSMGAVFRAHDRLTGLMVALKRVTREIAEDDLDPGALRLALAHEFRTLASLRHPHIISVLDYGFDSARQPFFTMELIEQAQPLLVAAHGLPLPRQIDLLIQALEALAYLHRRGVLHHDVKPANVLVSAGQVRLLDFGLAVLAQQQRDDDAFGTLLYLAPEVLAGQPYTEAADLYSIGVIAYELLTGQHPFPADTAAIFLEKVDRGKLDLTGIAAHPALADMIGQLLARAPSDRPASAQAAIAGLRAAAGLPAQASSAIRESYLQAATFVGREAEFATLIAALGQLRQGHGSAFLIGGESGVGKSRLLRELEIQALVEGVLVLHGQAALGGGAAFQLWRHSLRQLVVASEHIDDLSAGVLLPLIPDLPELLGRPIAPAPALEGQAAQIRLMSTIANLFAQQAQPLVLLLEDLQWAEESLLPLPYLLRQVSARPLLVVGSYRHDERPGLPAELPEMRRLDLARLSPEQVASLSEAILGEAGRQPELIERLQRETEGNTFFLVEIVRALAEEAGDLSRIGHASLPPRVLAGGVQQVVRRRLARVPAWAQQALSAAAAAGRQIDLPVLHALFPSLDATAWLRACADAAVLEVQDARWQFSHDKLREGLLAQLAPDQVRALHGAVAETLERLYSADDGYAAQLAYHWGQAGISRREAAACRRGASYASRQGSLAEAARLLNRAVELAGLNDRPERIDLHIQRGEVQVMLTLWAHAEADYRAALGLADTPHQAAGAQLALGRLYQLRSEYAAALEWLALAQQSYADHGDRLGLARTLTVVGQVWLLQGVYTNARASLEQGLAHARATNDQASIAEALHSLGRVAARQSEYAIARAQFDQALAIYRSIGDTQGIAGCLTSLGLIAYNQGDNAAAQALYEESLALRRATGHKEAIAALLLSLGNVAANLCDYASARARYTESLALAREVGRTYHIAQVLNNLGSLCSDEGDYSAARTMLVEALALRRTINDQHGLVSTLNNLAGVAAMQADYAASRAYYAESTSLALAIGDKEGVAYNLAGMAMLAVALGDAQRAAQLAAATAALLAAIDGALGTVMQQMLDQAVAQARAALDEARYQAAWAAGMRLGLEQAVHYAIAA